MDQLLRTLGAKLYDVNQAKNTSNEKTAHPCQIPEEVLRRIIAITAKEGDLIIDLFAGSGTTNAVAYGMGFDTIAYKVSSEYWSIIQNRLKNICL